MQLSDDEESMPDIPTLDSVGAAFPVLLATLVPQPAIRETSVSTHRSGVDAAGAVYQAATLTFAVLRNPDDLDDPVNHVPLHPDIAAAIEHPSPKLPAGVVQFLRWTRFPSAYEAVQTHVPRTATSTVAERLELHMWNVLANAFREQRHPGPLGRDSLVDPPSARAARDASVVVDGVELPAVTIADEHVVGLGVELDDAVATVVLAKHLLPLVRLELTRRARP